MAYSWSQSALATLHIDSAVFDLQQLTPKAHYGAEVCLKDTTKRQPHLCSRVYATLNYSLCTAYAAVLSALTQTNSDHQEVATKFPVHFHHLMWFGSSSTCLLTAVPDQRPHSQITCSRVNILALEYSRRQKCRKGGKIVLLCHNKGEHKYNR